MPQDPYADAVTGVLRNKLGLSAVGELETAEREITHAALIFLKEAPVQPSYLRGPVLPPSAPLEWLRAYGAPPVRGQG
jgi:fido (protein-threonine AMPylation protein)